MRNYILLISLFTFLSCKNNDNLDKFIVEQYNSKNNFSTFIIFDFDKSEILYFNSEHHNEVILKTPEEFEESQGRSIFNDIVPINTNVERLSLSNDDKSKLFEGIKNLERSDLKTMVGENFNGIQINYHLLYPKKIVEFNRINSFSKNLIALNKIIAEIIKKKN